MLLALGCSPEAALGSLRMTVGKDTTAEDIEYAVDTLAAVVAKLHILKA